MRKAIYRWILIIGVCFVFSCDLISSSQPTPSPTGVAVLQANASAVMYRPAGAAEQLVDPGTSRNANSGDGINVDPGGEALLSFSDYLQVRIFRDSSLSLESQIDPNAPAIAVVRLKSGTTFNTASSQALAGQRVQITTDYATIVATGTEFLVAYDPASEQTWVVDRSGTVQVTSNGVTVPVQPHWQTIVSPNSPPLPPIPASRLAVGSRFPTIESLTNGALKEADLLGDPSAQCTTNAETVLLTSPAKDAGIIKGMGAKSAFVPLSRTVVTGGETWLNGRDAQSVQGWLPSSSVTCGLEIGALAQAAPIPASPTPSPSLTLTPTLQVQVTPTLKPTSKPSSTLYAGTRGGIFKSTNAGSNWRAINAGLPKSDAAFSALAIDPKNPNMVYAGIAGGTEGGVYKSTNAGGNWSVTNAGAIAPNKYYELEELAIDPQTTSTIYAISNGSGLFKSTDAGGNWSPVNSKLGNWDTTIIDALAIDPQNPKTLYVGTGGLSCGIFKSPNGGSSWDTLFSGAAYNGGGFSALAIDPQNPKRIFAGTSLCSQKGMYVNVTTNGGGDWKQVFSGLPDLKVAVEMRALAIDPQNPNNLYAATVGGGIYKSTNGGESWQATNSGLTNKGVLALQIDPQNPDILYAGTLDGGIFKSVNGGENWSAVNSGLGNMNVSALAISP